MNETKDSVSKADRFRFRGFISVVTALSFIGLVVTGVVLFVRPPGRIANWGGWTFWGLTKEQWAALHIWSSVTILISAVFHTYLNWRALMSYFKSRPRRRFALRGQWILALLLYAGVVAGTLAMVPPFSSLVNWQHDIKYGWDRDERRAPFPNAELLTLAELARHTDAVLDDLMANLNEAGIDVASADTTIGDWAKSHGMTPEQLYRIALGETRGGRGLGRGRGYGRTGGRRSDEDTGNLEGRGGLEARGGRGRGGGGGMGLKTLRQFCADEGIELSAALETFRGNNIEARAGMTMREIADKAGIHPRDLRALLNPEK